MGYILDVSRSVVAGLGTSYIRSVVNSGTYTVDQTDTMIALTYSPIGASAITLPEISTLDRDRRLKVSITDEGGNATANNITISASGGDTISGQATLVINYDYDSVVLYSNGVDSWFIESIVSAAGGGGGGAAYTRSVVNSATYTVLQADTMIASTYSTTGTSAITLPQISTLASDKRLKVSITDEGGNAAVNNITISASGGDTIVGQATFVLDQNYNSVTLFSDRIDGWFVV